jgi:hypothetical protein
MRIRGQYPGRRDIVEGPLWIIGVISAVGGRIQLLRLRRLEHPAL